MWEELWTKKRSAVISVAGVALFLLVGLLSRFFPAPEIIPEAVSNSTAIVAQAPATPAEIEEKIPEPVAETPAPPAKWVVYITGNVRKPGIYELPAGSRLFQLVQAAGGLSGSADPAAVNLAAPLEDGLHVHVPGKEERLPGTPVIASQNPGPAVMNPAAQTASAQRITAAAGRKNPGQPGRVDVNRASEEELITLKGIGPALARNIIQYRQQNGRFRSVEDLLQVKGIGPKKLEDLRGSVTVGL